MFTVGDIVERTNGRWKGRRTRVVGVNGLITLEDGKGRRAAVLPFNLRVIKYPKIKDWLEIWHRANDGERKVLRRAFLERSRIRSSMRKNMVELATLDQNIVLLNDAH